MRGVIFRVRGGYRGRLGIAWERDVAHTISVNQISDGGRRRDHSSELAHTHTRQIYCCGGADT